uniref:Uncharacterized protein n=1 Tax=Leersia perrieri TaxID=77586 RepID=A0A0D9X3C9_9ORYZ
MEGIAGRGRGVRRKGGEGAGGCAPVGEASAGSGTGTGSQSSIVTVTVTVALMVVVIVRAGLASCNSTTVEIINGIKSNLTVNANKK